MELRSIEEMLVDHERRIALLERTAENPASPATGILTVPQRLSPRDFLVSKNPATLNDKVLVAGYYIEVVLGEASFTLDRLYEVFDEMRESPPGNRRDPPHNLERQGFFRPEGAKVYSRNANNRWTLTNAGRRRVEQGAFPRPKTFKHRSNATSPAAPSV